MDPQPSLCTALNFYEISYDDILIGYPAPHSSPKQIWKCTANSSLDLPNHDPGSTCSKMDADNHGGNLEQTSARSSYGSTKQHIHRKKSCRGDRHSKIPTAKGLRDRRMRLNLDVAKEFFSLMDLLGFDKASKGVKWLLMKAKPAIDELKELPQESSSINAIKSSSPISDCEVIESIVEHENEIPNKMQKRGVSRADVNKGHKVRQVRNDAFHPVAIEMRKKARERARERTRKKSGGRLFDDKDRGVSTESTNLDQDMLKDHYQCGEESAGSHRQNIRSSLEELSEIEQPIQSENYQFGMMQDFANSSMADLTPNWSPFAFCDYSYQGDIFQNNPVTELQLHEAYNFFFQHLCQS